MPIETTCSGCGQRLRVADEHAGKKARCPSCQTVNLVPGPATAERDPYAPAPLPDAYSTAPASPVSASLFPATSRAASQELWTLKLEDGRTFGPVARAELDKWHAEGRITPACQLMSDRDNRWRAAGEVYSSLGTPASGAAVNPFADRAAVNPYGSPTSFAAPRTWSEPHNGQVILVLGILSCVMCALLGPVAALMGHSALNAISRGRMDPEGHGLVLAGTILGWIGTVQILFVCMCLGLGGLGGMIDALD